MGLRTASVRHPHAEEVMAPALTEANQAQTFKLSPDDEQTASPVNSSPAAANGKANGDLCIHQPQQPPVSPANSTCKAALLANGKGLNNVLGTLAATNEISQVLNGDSFGPASDNTTTPPPTTTTANGDGITYGCNSSSTSDVIDCGALTMNHCLGSSMGDQDDKMGLQKVSLDDVTDLLKADTDVDQIFNNLQPSDADEIMQAFKAMDPNTSAGELPGADGDGDNPVPEMFSSGDLTLPDNALEDALFNVVDVMNMSIDEQLSDGGACAKETQTKERLADVGRKQARLERRLDFLLRRIRKFQVYNMGQHVSGEVAGVYEHVHRTMRRCRDELPKSASATTSVSSAATGASEERLEAAAGDDVVDVMLPEALKPLSYSSTKNLIKKLELSNALLANNACRQKQAKYFAAGDVAASTFRPPPVGQVVTLPHWSSKDKQELQNVAGSLESELRLVQEEVDSEATASSSGGESCDEAENYNNPHQQYLPIQKRAAWKFAIDRASIASKWTWLQSQIADLEYKIRQHTELHRKIRQSKEPIRLGGASPPHANPPSSSPNCLNGYRGQLPGLPTLCNGEALDGQDGKPSVEYQCARTRPLVNFRKRKLLQITGLHVVSKKAARPSSVRCGCTPPQFSCVLCTGRTDPMHPRDHSEYLSRNESLALLDHSYHAVFSLNEDVSASLHMEGIMKTTDWQQRSSRANLKSIKFNKTERSTGDKAGSLTTLTSPERPRAKGIEHRKKYNNRLIKPSTANAISAKIKNRFRGRKPSRGQPMGRSKKRSRMSSAQSMGSDGVDEEIEALGVNSSGKFDSPNSSPLLSQTITGMGIHKRNRVDSYDIDNIIIPYSVAASTRVERLQYKEILTPKWRIAEGAHNVRPDKNNGSVKPSQDNNSKEKEKDIEKDDTEEDLSDLSVIIRHEKSEQEERKKFLSFLKLPIGYGRSRANRRTDSRAESSGANTPDPMSPAPTLPVVQEPMTSSSVTHPSNSSNGNDYSPLTSPPATPIPMEEPTVHAISAARRRTISQTRPTREREDFSFAEMEVPPYEKRIFPLSSEMYERMVYSMPDDHRLMTNTHSRDDASTSAQHAHDLSIGDDARVPNEREHDSESTESAYGDEDPNDPEWDAEDLKERHLRTVNRKGRSGSTSCR